MKIIVKKAFGLWGTYLAFIPFICLIIYMFIAVSVTAPGAVVNYVSGWVASKVIITIISALIFVGSGIILGRNRG